METRTFASLLTDDKKIEVTGSALEIDFSGVPLESITAEQVQKIIRVFDRSVNLTAITLSSPPADNPQNAHYFKELCNQLLAIVARNRLIQDFELIDKLGLTPDAPGFDPWKEVMQLAIQSKFVLPGSMPQISYNASQQVVKKLPQQNFFKYFKDMGAIGFEKCWRFILSKDYPKNLPPKFEFPTESEIGMEPVEVLECINRLQEEKGAGPVPFSEFLILDLKSPLVHTQRFRDALLKFLKKNPHLEMFDIGVIRRHYLTEKDKDQDKKYAPSEIPPTDFLEFCATLEREEIATNIRLPFSHCGRAELDLASQRVAKKNKAPVFKAQAAEAVQATATIDTAHFTVPESWWLALPEEIEPEDLIYDQEVTIEAQIVAEVAQQAEQKIESQFESVVKNELDFKPNVIFVINKEQIIQRFGIGWYEQLAGTTKYSKDWTIDYATEDACNQIQAYPECFVDGLIIDPDHPENNNLPAGFELIKKFNTTLQKNEWTLFFDARIPEKKQDQALRVKLSKLRNKNGFIAEGVYQALVPDGKVLTTQEQKELKAAHYHFITAPSGNIYSIINDFKTLLRYMDPSKAEHIFKKYKMILEESFNHANFYAMRDMLQNKGGIDAIETFLENCFALHVATLYPSFKLCFLEPTTNYIDFNTPAAIEAIKYLVSMKSPYQKAWWNALVNGQQESSSVSGHFFADKVNAFRAFCEELQRMGLDITKINPPHHLFPVNNINVTLNRILLILKRNPQYAKDQLNHLDNINFGNDHAFYAVRQGFRFVTSEMDLCPESSCNDETLDYRVKFADLIDTANEKFEDEDENPATLQQTISYFFRYLATSETPLSINEIRTLVQQVTKENSDDKKPLSDEHKSLILPLLARAIDNASCLNLDNVAYCQKLLAILQEAIGRRKHLIQLLLNFANENTSFNVRDLVGMAHYYRKNEIIGDFKWGAINKVGPGAFKAFVHSGFRPQPKQSEIKKINPQEWSKLATLIDAKKSDEKERFYSAMALCQVSLTEAMTLFDKLSKDLAEFPATLKRLLMVLNQINPELSTQFPTNVFLEELIHALRVRPSMTGPQISDFLTKKMSGINFEVIYANKPFTEVDFQEELKSVTVSVKNALDAAIKDGHFVKQITETEQELLNLLQKCNTPADLLDSVNQLFKELGKIKSAIIKKKYFNPYAELKDICDKKIAADCTGTFADPALTTIFRTQVLQALGEVNLADEKQKEQRTRYFERYELYKSLCQKLRLHAEKSSYVVFGKALCEALTKAPSKEDKQQLLYLTHQLLTVYNDFDLQVPLFLALLKVNATDRRLFLQNFHEIYTKAPSCIPWLFAQYQESTNGPQDIVLFNTELALFLKQLPAGSHYSNLLQVLCNFNLAESLQILDKLAVVKNPAAKRLFLHVLNKVFIREPKAPFSKILGLITALTEAKIENEDAINVLYQKLQKNNCPSLDVFLGKLQENVPLLQIIEEVDLAPQGERDITKQFDYDPENLKRLVDLEFPLDQEDRTEELTEEFKAINLRGPAIAKLLRDELNEQFKAAKLNYAAKRTTDTLVELLAYLRELLYRSAPGYYFTNEMQMIAVLNAYKNGQLSGEGIDCGQGKGIVFALKAAVEHCSGHTVLVLTSDDDLSSRDFNEFKAFFGALDAEVANVYGTSPRDTFIVGGVNYMTGSDFGLYLESAEQRGESLRKKDGRKVTLSVLIDEEDDLLLSKSGRDQFILSTKASTDKKDDIRWMYSPINLFVDFLAVRAEYLKEDSKEATNAEFKKLAKLLQETKHENSLRLKNIDIATKRVIALEVFTLEKYLLSKAETTDQRNQIARPETRKLLKKLLQSGRAVKKSTYPKKNKSNGFQVKQYSVMSKEGPTVQRSVIEVLVDGQPIKGLQYGHGQQQLLADRLAEEQRQELKPDEQPAYPFEIGSLSMITSVMSPDDLMLWFKKDPETRILCASGSPGSLQQIAEKYKRYGIVTSKHNPQNKKQLTELPNLYPEDENGQFAAIKKTIFERKGDSKDAQTWLIHRRDIDKVEALQKLFDSDPEFKAKGFTIITLTARNKDKVKEIIDNYPKNTIIISTISGRGTNFAAAKEGKDTHPDGMGVIELDLVPERIETQGRDRTARRKQKGVYQRILNMAEVRADYSAYFTAKTASTEYPGIIKKIQGDLDVRSERQRDRVSMYYQLLSSMQRQLKKWQRLFKSKLQAAEEKGNTNEIALWNNEINALLKLRAGTIDEFNDQWQDLFILFHEKFKEYSSFEQQTSLLHDQIKICAALLWKQQFNVLNNRWQEVHHKLGHQPVPELPPKIRNHDVVGHVIELRKRFAVKSKRIAEEKEAKVEKSETALEDLKAPPPPPPKKTKPVVKEKHKALESSDPFEITKLMQGSSFEDSTAVKTIDQYREANSDKLLTECLSETVQSIRHYSSLWWKISSDRRTESRALLQLLEGPPVGVEGAAISNTTITYAFHIMQLNMSFEASLNKDIQYANSWTSCVYYLFTEGARARSTKSHYRGMLNDKKLKLLRNCPVSQLPEVIESELNHVHAVITIELTRHIYSSSHFASLQEKMQALLDLLQKLRERAIKPDRDQRVIDLADVYSLMESIVHHPQYNAARCGLSELVPSLSYLLKMTGAIQHIEPSHKINIASRLPLMINEIEVPKNKKPRLPTRWERLMGRTQPVVPAGTPLVPDFVKSMIGQVSCPYQKDQVNILLQHVHIQLSKEFKAIEITFQGKAELAQLNLTTHFKAIDKQTGESYEHTMEIDVDLARCTLHYQSLTSKLIDKPKAAL